MAAVLQPHRAYPAYEQMPDGDMSSDSLVRTGKGLCLSGAMLGVLGLLGWASGATILTTLAPGRQAMTANTALAVLLVGTAAALRASHGVSVVQKTLSNLAAFVALAIGVATLVEYGLGVDLYIDRALVRIQTVGLTRAAPLSSVAVSCLAAAVLLLDLHPTARVRPSEWLALSAGLMAFAGFTGVVLGATPTSQTMRVPVIGTGLPTAIGVILISTGLMLERPTTGIMRLVTSPGPGSIQIRRLALPAIVVPLVLGLIVERSFAAWGIQDVPVAVATLMAATTLLGLLGLLVTAIPLNRVHADLEASQAQTQSLIELAPDGIFIADLSGRYTAVNDAGCRILGCHREHILGKTIDDLIRPDDLERLHQSRSLLLRGATHVGEWRLRRYDGSYVPVEISARILPDGRWQGFVRDISERKRLEAEAAHANQQLRDSEERFRLALEEAPIGMALVGLDGRFLRVNHVLCEIVGYRPDELTRLTFQDITHPEDLSTDLELAGQLCRGEIPRYQREKRYTRKDGSIVDIVLNASLLRGGKNEPICYVAQIEDITERKRLETELRLSEAKSRGILSISSDAIISIDAAQRITLFNEGAEKIFGYSKREAIGAPLDILIPKRLRAIHRQHVEAFAAGQVGARKVGTRDAAIVGLRKDGTEFAADAAISKLDVEGTRVLTVVLRDITEQKRIENEQRFLAEMGPALATTLDYDETVSRIAEIAARGLSDFCIVDLVDDRNEVRRVKVISRDPSHAWIGDVLQHTPLDQRRPHVIRAALESKRPVLMQHPSPEDVEAVVQSDEQRRALGAVELQSLLVVPLVAHGRLLGTLSFLSVDPSRQFGVDDMRVADELAQRAALAVDNARLYGAARRAIQMRDEVLGIVAHDLRNPLAAVLMQAGLIQRRAAAAEPGFRDSVEAIRQSATRMNRLIQDLLDVTRLEAGQLAIEQSPVPAAQLASEAYEAQRLRASSAEVDLRLDLSQDLPEIWADRHRLLQVFDNLIGNAIKFTPRGGRITIEAAPKGPDVLFSVSDTGSGISVEDQSHLFDRFWQARTARRSGAGLGLSIVKGIVEAHGGSVWLDSAPGRGSTFLFTIPTAPSIDDMFTEPAPRLHDSTGFTG